MHRINSWAKAHASSRDEPGDAAATHPTTTQIPEIQPSKESSVLQQDDQVTSSGQGVASMATPVDRSHTNKKPGLGTRMRLGSIRFVIHTKDAICHSWVNVLLIFVPAGIAAEAAKLNPAVIFALNAVAIIPLAGLLSHATESVASRLGDTMGALINVSFGNAVELIIFIIALVKNEIRIVQASLLGSILANLLLILGMAFLLGGLRFQEQIYNSTVTQMSACLLSLSVTSLLLPTAFHASWSDQKDAEKYTLKVSRGTSVVLLLVYILYIVFQLRTHAYLYVSTPQQIIDEESHPGVLAEFMNSSSDSSSSSSDESVHTTSSWTTAKRIKRAMKNRRRRKSSLSSKGTTSNLPMVRNPSADEPQASADSSITNAEVNSCVIDFVDEHRYDADEDVGQPSQFLSRDFGNPVTQVSSVPSARERQRERKRQRRARKMDRTLDRAGSSVEPTDGARPSVKAFRSTPVFTDPTVSNPDPNPDATAAVNSKTEPKRRLPLGPLPSFLSNTVFATPGPGAPAQAGADAPRPGLSRSNSLPAPVSRQPTVGNAVLYARGAARATRPADTTRAGNDDGDEEPEMSRTAAIVMLLLSTGLVAACAEFLVAAIPQMLENSPGISETFIGLIILPIVGNAAEHVTAVSVAMKNKMDLSIGVSVGSSIQIAIFVTPLVVILGWCMDKNMTLYFTLFETISLFVTAFVVNFLVLDGRSNYLEGSLLLAAYIIIALAAFYYPGGDAASSIAG
ncbi:hypothetical protein N7539_008925 [Penicillium diatomitis]|uniref:Sodium/calcium exchanger membrane region domain-containing protein n=1 Tax=Penicillium diatomitis TaxID=2819901 RepID=A0A9W9WLD1_9EURO|nr:uncharacterized protein N7539_008925 [Penicillium diatomitis]KAJ5469307.1 hypothetical protein N7539_008925 [Penicillium diatomitis]